MGASCTCSAEKPELLPLKVSAGNTQMLAFGMTDYTQMNALHCAGESASEVSKAFVKAQIVAEDNVLCISSSTNFDSCTYAGMKATVQQQARLVKPGGLFIFYFCGHGIKIRGACGNASISAIAPADCDRTAETLITATTLTRWLNYANKGVNAVFILDCCYAGGLAKQLLQVSKKRLCILSACADSQKSLECGPLGQTIFSYFLVYSLSKIGSMDDLENLPLSDIFEECKYCCSALSSLAYKCDQTKRGLTRMIMEPQLDQPDGHSDVTEVAPFVEKYFRNGNAPASLSQPSLAWLNELSSCKIDALQKLAKRRLLNGRILMAVVCNMLWTIAHVELLVNRVNVEDPDLFLNAFLETVQIIQQIDRDAQFDLQHLNYSLEFYWTALTRNGVECPFLKELRGRIKGDVDSLTPRC